MKDYKKILEGVMNIINTTEKSDIGFVNICAYIGENCPELKDSEDERIRNWLIGYFHQYKEDGVEKYANGLKVESIIDWLERQGEQKTVPKFEVGDVMRTLQEAANGMTDGMPVVVSIDDEYYCCNNELIAIKDQDDYEYPPMNRRQKTAWSEDDEDNFKHLMDEIVCLGNSRNSANRLHYDRLIKFLYELKNRAQPREEWRDKDERMLDRLIAYFEKRVDFTDDDNPRYADWLKSLRPQNRWKPSNEQIGALEHFVRSITESGFASPYDSNTKLVYSLLNDLKKLKL